MQGPLQAQPIYTNASVCTPETTSPFGIERGIAIYRLFFLCNEVTLSFARACKRGNNGQWLRLSADIRKRIDAKLNSYATEGSSDVRRLKGIPGCRLRIGDWRVIFIEDARSITVVAVGDLRLTGRYHECSV
jgi:mRNA interferase RelE/StbE